MLRSILVAAILVPGIFLALTDRYKALLLYLWFALFRPMEWLWVDISGLRPSLILGLILLVPALLTGVLPSLTHPLSIGSVLFLGMGLLAQTNAVNQSLGWEWLDFLARLILVCLLAVSLIRTPRDLMRVVAVVAGSIGFHAAKAGLASILGGGVQFGDGLAGAYVDNNGYALASVMIIPLLVATGQNAELVFRGIVPQWLIRPIGIGWLVLAPLCAMTVISTFSRGGFLALCATVIALPALYPRRIRLVFGLSVLAVVAYLFVPLPKGYAARVGTIPRLGETTEAADTESDPGAGRLYFWQVAINMAAAHPLGVGVRNFDSTYDAFDATDGKWGRGRSVHSAHFQVLAELGYLGALLWTWLFLYAFRVVLRVKKRSQTPGLSPSDRRFMATLAPALGVSMIGFLVGGSFVALAVNDLTWLTFALVAALDRVSARQCAEVGFRPEVLTPTDPHRAIAGVASRTFSRS
jgi:probable O-glycosylation ligase (exosortase A-associated)